MTTVNWSRAPSRRPPGWRRGWGAGLLAMIALAVLASCSTARQRESPEGPVSLLRFRDAKTFEYFHHVYRTGNLYQEFRPALVVDAIFEDLAYRSIYVEMLRDQYFLPEAETQRLKKEQESQFDSQIDILVFVYEGTNQPKPLNKKNSPWKILLRDDDGQLNAPTSITKIKDDNPVYLYIKKYFSGLDRWSQVYRVRFPKLSKSLLGQPVGGKPFQLIFTGVKGTVTLKWEDAGIFYRN